MRSTLCLAVVLVLAGFARPSRTPAQEAPANCPNDAGALPTSSNPGGLHGAQIPIDNIVVLMQENRSFDHYFSRLRRVDAPDRHASNPDPLGGPPIQRFHQTRLCETADLDHGWTASHEEWNEGAMDGFTAANVDPTDLSGSRTMGYYTRYDLPYYYKLYGTFATSDRHFCSLLGPTYPNRYYLLTGSSFGWTRNTFPDFAGVEYSQPTIFEQLDAAGISWKLYFSDLPFAFLFGYFRSTGSDNQQPVAQYFIDAAAGTLPQVAFIDPAFLGENENDEHPPSNAQKGQEFVSRIVGGLTASPQWAHAALFITYDEHGGYWDHVAPPPACAPDAIAPLVGGPWNFDRYGVRVPFLLVSPYARKRYVSHTVTDQTSVLRFIQTRHDLPALTRRDANADPLLEMFDFDKAAFATPPKLPVAKIDPVRAAACP